MEQHDERFPESKNFINSRIERLNKVYRKINEINEDESPHALAKKVTLYGVAQAIIGDLYAQSVYDAGVAYNNRKEAQAVAELSYFGTVKERECYGITAVADLKRLETKAEAERQRWEKAFYSTENLANAIKHELKVTFFDYGNGGGK